MRTSKVGYYESRGAWFTVINGRQELLAKGPKSDKTVRRAAENKFAELMAENRVGVAGDDNRVHLLLDRFACHLEGLGNRSRCWLR
jgi:hypothetical protein